jgi:two-component system chemotaxis family response regulator WspR
MAEESALDVAVPDEDTLRVLLVDDQAMIGEAVRRALLDQTDIEFHFCSDAHEALATAERVKPTVILQDLVMPGLNGLSLLRQYRAAAALADVPVVVLSTKEEPWVKSEAFGAGATDYLVKLPDAIELVARIRHHSKAYVNQVQRDIAYRALRASQQELMEKNIELERLTNVDGLTGLSNRRYFDEYLQKEWERAQRERMPLALLMMDVDHFKLYNDSYGHLGGDDVLRRVAAVLRQAARRPADVAARYGGEEFALIMPGTPLEGAVAQAETLRAGVEALALPHRASLTASHVTISIGAASIVPERPATPSALIHAADGALYQAKRAGRNRVLSSQE